MKKILITGIRKGTAPEGKMEYDVRIGDSKDEKIVVAKSEKDAIELAQKGKFLDIEKVYGKKKRGRKKK